MSGAFPIASDAPTAFDHRRRDPAIDTVARFLPGLGDDARLAEAIEATVGPLAAAGQPGRAK